MSALTAGILFCLADGAADNTIKFDIEIEFDPAGDDVADNESSDQDDDY